MTSIPSNEVSPALEDYLETILDLCRENGRARVVDIAGRLEVGKPAVTAALKTLSDKKLINYSPYKAVSLTERGNEIAEGVHNRHLALKSFLVDILGMDVEAAEIDACKMEHAIGPQLLERLGLFARYVGEGSRSHKTWLEKFRKHASDQIKEREAGE